jgi:hypothetical protein
LPLERGILPGWPRFLVMYGYARSDTAEPVTFRFAGLELEEAKICGERAAECRRKGAEGAAEQPAGKTPGPSGPTVLHRTPPELINGNIALRTALEHHPHYTTDLLIRTNDVRFAR